ncbi:aminoglycoside phosphotransferase family protein [Streptomyces sp. VRA16 Mangrove soil]|uniref:aminoglycoside phosphotransferase family protein n=1 Tax=Streptomyces sp. VRA16 Mangrove soil TaxID=2817434 RepID=UPI001A9E8024|nr:aminoglycoside phosphotransferase family protein [Streptomyces sp. VRA16 Mangrove soil]MBO1330541.1 aminoglycoside phosphotransferase family protein [Streptomyces sp. VRA16 Mangrove soil]
MIDDGNTTETVASNDIVIDEALVRDLLRAQHPDLAELALWHAATGWDHQVWRLGEELVVRVPCFDASVPAVRNEQRWLPELAPRLPMPVPRPRRIGEPSARFPRPWTVTTWVPGEPADREPIAPGTGAPKALGAFLGALHAAPAPEDAPTRPGRGVPLAALPVDIDQLCTDLEAAGERATAVRALWDDALAAPAWEGERRWLHSDLHPANVVVRDGALAGIIDFGDVCAGDPATDLCAAWLLLPEGEAAPFFDAYGLADDATIRRARGWAVLRAAGLIAIGRAGDRGLPGGKPTWGPAGRAALERALAFG